MRIFTLFFIAALISTPRPAKGAPRPAWARVLNPEMAIPSNGAVLIATEWTSEAPTIRVSQTGAPSMMIGGSVARRGGLWAWMPAASLEPGSYDVSAQAVGGAWGADLPLQSTITVVDAFPIEPPALTIQADLSLTESSDVSCCSREPLGTAGHCIYSATHRDVQMHVYVESSSTPELLHQFLLGAVRAGDTNKEASLYSPLLPLDAPLVYLEQATEYCFEVIALDVTTGALHTYPDSGCLAHGELGPTGTEVLDVPDAFFDRRDCPAPPYDLEARWCEHNQNACDGLSASEVDEAGCRYYDFACKGAPDPDLPEAGEGGAMNVPPGAAGSGGSSADAGVVDAPTPPGDAGHGGAPAGGGASGAAGMQSSDDQAPPSEPPLRASASGCGCATAGSGGAGPALTAVAWLLALVALRTRRSTTR